RPPADLGISGGIDLVHIGGAIDRIGHGEAPAFVAQFRLDDRDRDYFFEPLELAPDEGARRPGTDQRDIEVIAAGLGLEAGFSGRPGAAIGRHPIAEARGLPHKTALGVGALNGLPIVGPLAVDEHFYSPRRTRSRAMPQGSGS